MTNVRGNARGRTRLVSVDHPVALMLGSGFKGLSGLVKPVRRIAYAGMEGFSDEAVSRLAAPSRALGAAPARTSGAAASGSVLMPSGFSAAATSATAADGLGAPEATAGTIDGVPVIAYPTRLHLYQGFSAPEVAALVRHAHGCGCRAVVFVGASGLVGEFDEPALGLVSDHINLTGRNPLVGAGLVDAFVPMRGAYDEELRALARAAAKARGIELREGVYAEVTGPSLETAAEAAVLSMMGATFVGMSLSLETIMARALGMRVLALTLATNPAGAEWVSRQSVRTETTSYARELEVVMRGVLAQLV